MTNTIRCLGCNRRRVPFAKTLLRSPRCRMCTEKYLADKLGRLVLLSPAGKDSVSGKSFEELAEEANAR